MTETTLPNVRGLPFLGSALSMLPDPCRFLVRKYHELGPIFRLHLMGRELTVLAGPEANLLLTKHGDRYFSSKEGLATLCKELETTQYLAALDGDAHRQLRRTLKPGFSREAISPAVPRLVEHVERTARAWPVGHGFEVLGTMQQLLVEEAALAMANGSAGPLRDVVTFGQTLIGVGVAMQPQLLAYRPSYRAAKAHVHDFVQAVIRTHEEHPPGAQRHPDLIDTVLAARDDAGRPLDAHAVMAVAHMPWVNSALYPSRVCSFALYELLTHPDVLARVTAEVDATFAAGVPDASALRCMRLLRGVVLETLRLYPLMFALPRRVIEPLEFAGHHVPCGADVLVAIGVCHFLPQLFPQPERFDIERYSAPRNEHCQAGALSPFGLGSHACISAGTTEALMMLTIASLLRTVQLALDPPGYTLRTVLNPLPGPAASFRLRVVAPRVAPTAATRAAVAESEMGDLFHELSEAHLAGVLAKLQRHTFAPGATIIHEGEVADRFYVLTKGEVEVWKARSDGPPQLVARLGSGECCGEIGILQGLRRNATVRVAAHSAAEAWSLDAASFLDLVRDSDLTSAEIARLVHRRTIATTLAVALPALAPEQIARVSSDFQLICYPPGSVIIRQGDAADRFFIIVKGRVEILNHHPNGHDIPVGALAAGQYFGEVGLLQRRPRTATVRAAADTEVEVMALDAGGFERLLAGSHRTSAELALVMCERLVALAERNPT